MNTYEWIGTILVIVAVLAFLTAFLWMILDMNFSDVGENVIKWSFAIALISLVLGGASAIYGSSINVEQQTDACKKIGGNYIVVGHETTEVMSGKVMIPQTVDVYGCVKG